jgi:hypothetical protein
MGLMAGTVPTHLLVQVNLNENATDLPPGEEMTYFHI